MGAPDAPCAGFADAGGLRHGPCGPMGSIGRDLLERHFHHSVHPPGGEVARLARTRRVLRQSLNAALEKTAPATEMPFPSMMPMSCAICLFSNPAAASKIILACSTTRAGSERARAGRSKATLCSELSTIASALRMILSPLV
jgi:hypothetical protein